MIGVYQTGLLCSIHIIVLIRELRSQAPCSLSCLQEAVALSCLPALSGHLRARLQNADLFSTMEDETE